MSDSNQINTALERLFNGDGQRIVSWNDPEQEFQSTLKHAADQRISLDLDNGVKVNDGKFGDLLAEAKAVCGATDEE